MKYRKLLFSVVFLIVAFSLVSLVNAKDIAYVVANPNIVNPQFISAIKELNYTYDVIDDANVGITNFSSYKVILVGNDGAQKVPVNSYSSLIVTPSYNTGWSDGTGYIVNNQPTKSKIMDSTHYIIDGLSGTFQVYTSAKYGSDGPGIPMYYLEGRKYSTKRISTVETDINDYVLATKENPKRIFFGATETQYWTAGSKLIFKNSLKYLVRGDRNTPPQMNGNIPDLMWLTGETRTLNLANYFTDADGDVIKYGIDSSSSNTNIVVEKIGDSEFLFVPRAGWTGTDWIIFNATDGREKVLTNKINLIVTDHSPIISPVETQRIKEGEKIEFVVNAFDPDGNTMTLSVDNLNAMSGANFTDNGNGTGKFSWTPNFDQSGSYTIKFRVKDSTNLTTTTNGRIIVENVIIPPAFNDVDVCEKNEITPELKITIKEPDDGDDFDIRDDVIDGKVEIKNNADEDMKVKIKAYLYDLDEDEEIEKFDDSIKVKKGKDDDVDFDLEIPKDIPADNKFVVLIVGTADEDKDYCNYAYVEIEFNREKHDVIIEDIKVNPDRVGIGAFFELILSLLNIGENDEDDVYVEIRSDALGISATSDKFDLDEPGDDDDKRIKFNLEVPQGAKPGVYDIFAEVFYDDGDESNTEKVSITITDEILRRASSSSGSSGGITGGVINLNGGSNSGVRNIGQPVFLNNAQPTKTGNVLNLNGGSATNAIDVQGGSPLKLKSGGSLSVAISEKEEALKEKSPKTEKEREGSNFFVIVLIGLIIGIILLIIAILAVRAR